MKRNTMGLVGLVLTSLLLIGVLTMYGPRIPPPEKNGPVEVNVEIDFGGQGPGKELGNTSAIWVLNDEAAHKDNWTTEYIVVYVKSASADWSIQLEMNNTTVYGALVKASSIINFTIKSDWYPNFNSHRVSEIAGVHDGTDNRYWQYYVNGQYMDKGADLVGLADGDSVRWEFRSALQ